MASVCVCGGGVGTIAGRAQNDRMYKNEINECWDVATIINCFLMKATI